jgi:hypothetical protein
MISYLKQVPICNDVRKAIERSLSGRGDASFRGKISKIPTVESVLRAVSLNPNLNTEEDLRAFITQHIYNELRLTKDEQEQFKRISYASGEESPR